MKDEFHRGPPSSRDKLLRKICVICHRIIENSVVGFVTTVLTLWVLFCDDVRVLSTQKPVDPVFEVILIVSIVIFALEIIFTCLGKEDYFMSFFFILDLVSTGSLVLDLPSLQETMASQSDSLNSASEGKSARIGAKAARVVRIVRLVRIVKLYKILVTHFEKRFDAWMGLKPGEDAAFLDEDGLLDEEPKKKESRVGKQLSHATLKRVIVLILAMLVVVPSLSASETLKYPVSCEFGADEISETFKAMQSGDVPRIFYEQSMLRYIYYHNWFTGHRDCPSGKTDSCPNIYYNHLFWVGVSGTDVALIQSKADAAKLDPAIVTQWENNITKRNDLYNFGSMPLVVRESFSNWRSDCKAAGKRLVGFSMLAHNAGGDVSYIVKCPSDLRAAEVDMYFPRLIDVDVAEKSHFVFYFDMRKFLREEAMFGIFVTIYVCFALCIAVMFFSRDANQLVLSPVESMIAKVEKIRENPLAAVKMGDQEFRQEESERIRTDLAKRRLGSGPIGRMISGCQVVATCSCYPAKESKQPMETLILEKTLVKLGSLLALGFGEAGANIINKNMSAGDTADVDVMIQGDRVECIYGQAKIQDFSVVTEVLQSKVMTFVNQIAEIVHGVVVEFLGAANKNHGDTFLLVWRASSDDGLDVRKKLADMSVAAFGKILVSIQQSPDLDVYRRHPRIKFLLGKQYRVCLNVGLHAGWAFEGAMGSEYKIDASYISPNIAITANIEQATQHFRVPFLISKDVISLCSEQVANATRLIDVVTIAGHKEPMDLHCLDIDQWALSAEERRLDDPDSVANQWNPRLRYTVRQSMDAERNKTWQDATYAYGERGLSAPCIRQARQKFTVEFTETFKMGLNNYLEGEWAVAQALLVRAERLLGGRDGPSASLMAFMQQTKCVAPQDWRGCRDLAPLLQGPPKNPPRPPQDAPMGMQHPKDVFDRTATPTDGGVVPDTTAAWQLPNAVPQDKELVIQKPKIIAEKQVGQSINQIDEQNEEESV